MALPNTIPTIGELITQLNSERSPKTRRYLAALIKRRRRLARDELLPFVEQTHPRWTSGAHHRLLCEHLERVERGEVKRLMIFMPPRHSKSEIATKRFPAWCLGRNPHWQIICASHTAELAKDFGAEVRDIVADPEYLRIFPNTQLHPDAKAAGRWRTTSNGIYIAAGVGGSIVGRGAHVAIIDDPVSGRNDAESPRMREVAWRWYLGDMYQRLMPDGAIVLIMTRWHEDDLAGRAMLTDDWAVLNMPAISGEHSDHEAALWPEFWPLEELQKKRAVFSEGGRLREWRAQYQQQPTAEEGDYIKREWLMDRWEALPPKLNVFMATDFAVTKQREGADPDYTHLGIFGIGPDNRLYVLDWWYGQETADIWVDKLLDLVAKHKPIAVFTEKGVIRNSVEPYLARRRRERRIYFREEPVASAKDKELRGRAFQAMAASGQVLFPSKAPWLGKVIDEIVTFPAATHDDAFDVVSQMCLAIDQAHPAIVVKKPDPKRDGWRDTDRSNVRGWRVA